MADEWHLLSTQRVRNGHKDLASSGCEPAICDDQLSPIPCRVNRFTCRIQESTDGSIRPLLRSLGRQTASPAFRLPGLVLRNSASVEVPALPILTSHCSRTSGLRNRYTVQFRAEAFNLSNTPAFSLPAANSQALTIGNAAFGKLTSSSATGRQLQMGLKFLF